MGGYRLLEHTADMGIEATAETPEELFVQAACALWEIIAAHSEGVAREERVVEITAEDRGELLVNWLNEILYLFEIRGFFPVEFAVEEVEATRLKARIRGETFDPKRHLVEREVKAVTYHQLTVEKVEGGWRARTYVDL